MQALITDSGHVPAPLLASTASGGCNGLLSVACDGGYVSVLDAVAAETLHLSQAPTVGFLPLGSELHTVCHCWVKQLGLMLVGAGRSITVHDPASQPAGAINVELHTPASQPSKRQRWDPVAEIQSYFEVKTISAVAVRIAELSFGASPFDGVPDAIVIAVGGNNGAQIQLLPLATLASSGTSAAPAAAASSGSTGTAAAAGGIGFPATPAQPTGFGVGFAPFSSPMPTSAFFSNFNSSSSGMAGTPASPGAGANSQAYSNQQQQLATYQPLDMLRGFAISHTVFSPSGKLLAVAALDGHVGLWSTHALLLDLQRLRLAREVDVRRRHRQTATATKYRPGGTHAMLVATGHGKAWPGGKHGSSAPASGSGKAGQHQHQWQTHGQGKSGAHQFPNARGGGGGGSHSNASSAAAGAAGGSSDASASAPQVDGLTTVPALAHGCIRDARITSVAIDDADRLVCVALGDGRVVVYARCDDRNECLVQTASGAGPNAASHTASSTAHGGAAVLEPVCPLQRVPGSPDPLVGDGYSHGCNSTGSGNGRNSGSGAAGGGAVSGAATSPVTTKLQSTAQSIAQLHEKQWWPAIIAIAHDGSIAPMLALVNGGAGHGGSGSAASAVAFAAYPSGSTAASGVGNNNSSSSANGAGVGENSNSNHAFVSGLSTNAAAQQQHHHPQSNHQQQQQQQSLLPPDLSAFIRSGIPDCHDASRGEGKNGRATRHYGPTCVAFVPTGRARTAASSSAAAAAPAPATAVLVIANSRSRAILSVIIHPYVFKALPQQQRPQLQQQQHFASSPPSIVHAHCSSSGGGGSVGPVSPLSAAAGMFSPGGFFPGHVQPAPTSSSSSSAGGDAHMGGIGLRRSDSTGSARSSASSPRAGPTSPFQFTPGKHVPVTEADSDENTAVVGGDRGGWYSAGAGADASASTGASSFVHLNSSTASASNPGPPHSGYASSNNHQQQQHQGHPVTALSSSSVSYVSSGLGIDLDVNLPTPSGPAAGFHAQSQIHSYHSGGGGTGSGGAHFPVTGGGGAASSSSSSAAAAAGSNDGRLSTTSHATHASHSSSMKRLRMDDDDDDMDGGNGTDGDGDRAAATADGATSPVMFTYSQADNGIINSGNMMMMMTTSTRKVPALAASIDSDSPIGIRGNSIIGSNGSSGLHAGGVNSAAAAAAAAGVGVAGLMMPMVPSTIPVYACTPIGALQLASACDVAGLTVGWANGPVAATTPSPTSSSVAAGGGNASSSASSSSPSGSVSMSMFSPGPTTAAGPSTAGQPTAAASSSPPPQQQPSIRVIAVDADGRLYVMSPAARKQQHQQQQQSGAGNHSSSAAAAAGAHGGAGAAPTTPGPAAPSASSSYGDSTSGRPASSWPAAVAAGWPSVPCAHGRYTSITQALSAMMAAGTGR